jgi:3-oxoacyl-[acyl-carrier protein] reductase
MKLLENKVAVITGATRGIGKGIAQKFAEQGASIAFTFVSSEQKAKALEDELSQMGIKAKGYKSNAGDFNAAQELIDGIVNDFGQIDVLINNAGITKDGLLMRMSEENWDDVMDINLKSVFNLTKASLRTFLKQKVDL